MEFSGERFIPNKSEYVELEIEHLQRYNSVCEYTKDKIVVDAACGEGYGSFLISKYATKVYGVDISSETIEHAEEVYKKDNLSFLCASVTSIPLDNNSVDIIISYETIEHIGEKLQEEFLKEAKRILKEDGILIVSTPNKLIYSDLFDYHNEFHIKEFYEDEFKVFLSSYFNKIEFYEQRFEVASILDKKNSEKLNVIKIEGEEEQKNAKYLIAICSDKEIDSNLEFDSVVLEKNNKLIEMTKRILKTQDEIEKLSQWGKSQEGAIEEKNTIISSQNQTIEELSAWGTSLDKEMVKRDEAIISQNQRIEELSAWGISQDKEISKRDKVVLSQNQRIEELSAWGVSQASEIKERDDLLLTQNNEIEILKREINELKASIDEISACRDSAEEENSILKEEIANFQMIKIEEIIAQLEISNNELITINQTVLNQQGHIELLLVQERKLNNIYISKGWKLLQWLYRLEDMILPLKSKRRQCVKLFYKTIKNVKRIIRNINFSNIKKFAYHIKKQGITVAWKKIFNYLDMRKAIEVPPLKIFESNGEYRKIIFPKAEKPEVSIIIPVYNQWNYTYSCLDSIQTNTEGINYEIIVADDVSNDETINIKNYIENIKVVRNKENKGFLLNCNNAAKHAKGKYILLLNNDTNVQKDCLKYLVDLIESDSSIGMVGSKFVYADGRLQEAGGIIWNDASGWNYGRLDDPEKSEYNYIKEVDYISGAGIMIRSDIWKKIGGFDERYAPAYYEDSDLAFEVRKHGYMVVFQPKSIIVHFEGISNGTDTGSGIKSYQVKNKEKFIEKWKVVLQKEHFENAQNVFLARDRSRAKKTILVIDHYVPHYDRDAGGRCTYQYIKLFNDLGLKIVFVGDNFFRHEPYTTELQQMGVEVLYGNWYFNNIQDWIKDNGKYFDYAYLNRPHISIKYIDTLKKYTNAKIIYFGHDLHYLRELRNYEFEKDEELLKSAEKWKKIEFELFNKSDVIYVVGSYEQAIVQQEFPEKPVRNIPLYIYDGIDRKQTKSFKERDGLLFVGGFGHKPNYDAMIWFIHDILPMVKSKLPDIKLYIVGSNPPDDIMDMHSESIIVTGFVSDEKLIEYYSNCKIAVVPLRYGAGVKGKIVEAIYNKIPVITTSIGAEGLNRTENVLTIENSSDGFAKKVIELYNNIETLNAISKNCPDYIEKYFMKSNAIEIIKEDINI